MSIGQMRELSVMAFETGTNRLICPDCGAVHKARWERIPLREWQQHECQKCPGYLIRGSSVRDYVQITLETE